MSTPARLAGATGAWRGTYRLWFDPDGPAVECETTAEVTAAGGGRFLALRYGWSFEGKPQEGFLLLGDDPAASRCEASWVDSFHNSDRIMPCTGALAGDGPVSVRGSYPAPPGPDWGWRTELDQPSADTLVLRQFNVTPDGVEGRAVEATWRRR
jgi:hypothetical protein